MVGNVCVETVEVTVVGTLVVYVVKEVKVVEGTVEVIVVVYVVVVPDNVVVTVDKLTVVDGTVEVRVVT